MQQLGGGPASSNGVWVQAVPCTLVPIPVSRGTTLPNKILTHVYNYMHIIISSHQVPDTGPNRCVNRLNNFECSFITEIVNSCMQ